jgi:hypothetical protein
MLHPQLSATKEKIVIDAMGCVVTLARSDSNNASLIPKSVEWLGGFGYRR